MSDKEVCSYAVYPAIGIARVGNSPDEYFIGPEAPGETINKNKSFKDDKGRVKRQVARFRVYGLNAKGKVVREIVNEGDTQIAWRVELANRKAIGYQFNNAMDLGDIALESQLRNASITNWDERRQDLLIAPGQRHIKGCNKGNQAEYRFDNGKFFGKKVYLGELRTDKKGRLLVLGGRGESASYDGAEATTFANNDGWHDDVSDGPVRATVTIKGKEFEAKPAMVAVTPPNFGPGLRGVVTMYDVVADLFYRENVLELPKQVEFWRDIYPIFQRLVENQAVNEGIYFMFGQNSPGDFNNPQLLDKLISPDREQGPLREYIFKQFRDPNKDKRQDAKQPPFYGDAFGDFDSAPDVNLSVTKTQYQQLKEWAKGNFKVGNKQDDPEKLQDIPIEKQGAALTATNLLECLGGPFHPGIELTWFLRRLSMWDLSNKHDPFRLNIMKEGETVRDDYGPILRPKHALKDMFNESGPGTLTRFMGIPWQTDEASCRSGYDTATYLPTPSFWSARVPNQVLSTRSLERIEDKQLPIGQRIKHMDHRQDWLRFFQGGYQPQINAMVQHWSEIGIIRRRQVENTDQDAGIPNVLWVESEVAKRFTEDDPSYKQLLMIENLAGVEPKAEDIINEQCGIDKQLADKSDQNPPRRRVYRRDEI
ncbi:LodA/GoxA family CTQ-dependent oxidase [Spartinivicinus poritis]|uniref:LodA/GoxA family CTQ-dependent oxidase n=1 Tax=Spartinivicinus poritis TaxID=2994640 RepID=A0ABT5U394_9GAMM|nr:LodA/GoxA family CTQ-dependent oxidase [Spartinivicinus sp. A2-2]MDE1460836.1 LodA/GoxA family CTQ-dependent oxidase [Spartinivicinus sp. A2-2]